MIRTAYLRAYLPASVVGGLPPHRTDGESPTFTQQEPFIWTESTRDDAIYTVWEGAQFVCPRNTRLRMIEGILAFTKTNPELPLLSDAARSEYVSELVHLRKRSRTARGYILSSAWYVPLRWFGAFRQGERELYERADGTSIRYRTSLGEAVDRVRWAASVLDSAGFAEQAVDRVRDLERWLSDFGPDSMVELDYGDAARSFQDAELAFDESADDIRLSLLALEQAEYDESREAYERVGRRWAAAQSYTFSN